MVTKNHILQKIISKFARCRITAVRKASFDFVLSVPEDEARIIGGVARNGEPDLGKRVDEILSVSKVVQAHPILITEGQELPNKNITCIDSNDFPRIKDPKISLRSPKQT